MRFGVFDDVDSAMCVKNTLYTISDINRMDRELLLCIILDFKSISVGVQFFKPHWLSLLKTVIGESAPFKMCA